MASDEPLGRNFADPRDGSGGGRAGLVPSLPKETRPRGGRGRAPPGDRGGGAGGAGRTLSGAGGRSPAPAGCGAAPRKVIAAGAAGLRAYAEAPALRKEGCTPLIRNMGRVSSPLPRSTLIISAAMHTAISAGVSAPMLIPIGARTFSNRRRGRPSCS